MSSQGSPARKRRRRWERRTEPGEIPGTMRTDPTAPAPSVSVFAFGPDHYEEKRISSLAEISSLLGRSPVTWVNVDGLGDEQTLLKLGEIFGLHRLALEDVVNVHQRPKVEDYGDHVFVVTRMPAPHDGFETEQISLFLGAGYLLSFQEQAGDCFDPIRDRIRRRRGRVRDSGADYLTYALLDAVLDDYFPLLEHYGERVEALEAQVLERPDEDLVGDVHRLKRELLNVRRAIWPQREMLNALIRDDSPFVTDPTRLHLRDCVDHTIQLIDILEIYRETASGLVDIYLSSMSTRLNEVMKVLTIIATIFIPLSFVASVYGMNFDAARSPWNMPELEWYLGYPFALALMAAIAGGLLLYFRRAGWIGKASRPSPRGVGPAAQAPAKTRSMADGSS